jgi:hypothetical protein
MILTFPFATALFLAIALVFVWFKWREGARADYIRRYTFPKGLYEKLQAKRPELTLKDCQLTGHALRQFFLTYLKSGRQFVSMPSQVVDDLWHELILYTKTYEQFCQKAFGRFMHHSPAAILGSGRESNAGLRRCWWYACLEENINPKKPTRLPLLFALDAKLNIKDGFRYAPDCKGFRKNEGSASSGAVVYCGGDFSSPSFDGTTTGFGDIIGDGAGMGGDSGDGGCGGGGCGGD